MKRFAIRVVLMLVCLTSVLMAALEEEVALERQFTQRVQTALDSIYGPHNFFVAVDITLTEAKYEVKYTQQSDPKLNENNSKKDEEIYILPGYPVIKNLSSDNLNQLPFDSVTTLLKPEIQSISVSLVINKDFPRGNIGKVKAMITDILKLDAERDTIEITSKTFYQPPISSSEVSIARQADPWRTTQNVLFGLMVLMLFAFLVLYIYFQQKTAKLPASKAKSEPGTPSSESSSSGPGTGIVGSLSGLSGSGVDGSSFPLDGDDFAAHKAWGIRRYFNFINDRTIQKLLFIIERDKLGVEQLAVIIGYLEPKYAAEVIEHLNSQDQIVVGLNLLNQRKLNPSSIEKLEEHIKSSLECLIGGEDHFKNTFKYVKDEMKKPLLLAVQKTNQEGYQKFRSNIVLFEDIKLLTDAEMKLLLSEVPMVTLQMALIQLEKDVYQKIFKNLTGAAKEMVRQFIELKGKTVSKDHIETARKEILILIDRMEQQKLIDLSGKIK